MKTVLTEILDYLHLDKNYEKINENLQIHDIVYKISNLLEKEKQQIIDAYQEGIEEAYSRFNSGMNMSYWKDTNKEQYYEQTYK